MTSDADYPIDLNEQDIEIEATTRPVNEYPKENQTDTRYAIRKKIEEKMELKRLQQEFGDNVFDEDELD